MTWLTSKQGQLLIRFLEPLPPLNNHRNLKTSYVCFYSSEMKNLKQILESLEAISAGGWNQLDADARKRYQNTLTNLGLISENSENPQITPYGIRLIEYAHINNIGPDALVDTSRRQFAWDFEKILLQNLLDILNNEREGFVKAKEYAAEKIYSIQEFVNSIPGNKLSEVIEDLDFLLFLQLINSSRLEIKRYYLLSEDDQAEAYQTWSEIKGPQNFPDTEPADFFQRMAYHYTRPLGKKTIQADIRFRVQAAVKAYIDLRSTNQNFPTINADLEFRRIENMQQQNDGYTLENPQERFVLPVPNQLIVCGCPGSGKSRYIRELLHNDTKKQVRVITFHPDYSYSDLIGSYKPIPVYEASANITRASGRPFNQGIPRINYEFMPGPLVEQYIFAIKNPNLNFYLVIEEINRANCNSVFGDFFQLLDRDTEGTSQYAIDAMPDLLEFFAIHGIDPRMRLPKNLYILGTMNSADQGVFPLDSAFRRRWEFQYRGHKTACLYPKDNAKIKYGGRQYDWDNFRNKINLKLTSMEVHEDKLIGPYFLSMDEISNPEKVLNKLFLYLWEDVLRFQRRELMNFYSFADVTDSWSNGEGSPLQINFNENNS